MLKRLACGFLLLAGGLLSSGCCMFNHGGCGAGVGCDSCDSCDSVGYQTCGECQPGLCHHPWLWSQASNALSCGAGCGEVYHGEWTSDPPACGDPCGSCGDYSCGGCGGCWNPLRGLAALWGYRYASGGCGAGSCDGGCDSCAESYDTVTPMDGPMDGPIEAREKSKSKRTCPPRNRTCNRRPPSRRPPSGRARRSGTRRPATRRVRFVATSCICLTLLDGSAKPALCRLGCFLARYGEPPAAGSRHAFHQRRSASIRVPRALLRRNRFGGAIGTCNQADLVDGDCLEAEFPCR